MLFSGRFQKDVLKESKMQNERFESGLKKLEEIDGEAGKKVINSLESISPDLAKYTIEFPFGDIYRRPGLDLKSREIATVAALTALGNCQPQLNVHINGALNVGCKPEEIIETIIQMAVYAGFPAALNGMFVAKEVFLERNIISEQPAPGNARIR
jgi:4-carboxymuconolactone decarboxylase